ncbi:hypothetical protein TSUD_196130 [Trifolium subterraneum]|nr:hypothetical protein TSUD_196130 [Trifolium subterraneum]
MSGWDEGGVYYSDQAHSWDDGRGEGEATASNHTILQKFKEFIRNFETGNNVFPYRERLLHNPKFLTVDMEDLDSFDPDLPSKLRSSPADILPLFETAAAQVLVNLKTKVAGDTGVMEDAAPGDVQILLTSKEDSVSLRSLGAQYISKLVKIAGITIAASRTKAKATYVTLICKNCKKGKQVPCRPGLGGAVVPRSCDHVPQPGEEPCPIDPWLIVPDKSKYVDQQTLKLQENPEDVPTGELPRNLLLSVDRHLVQTVVPGSRLTIIGIYSIFQASNSNTSNKGAVAVRQPYVRVVGIEDANEAKSRGPTAFTTEEIEEFKKFAAEPAAYKNICSKIAPSIFGHDDVKKAVACLLFGGSRKHLPDGVRLRGDINVLLLGDPSTAKSQFLKFVEKTAPIAVYTSGKGSSAAGLTASVIQDSSTREFYLEGGAMVLADGGVVCIDEFDKMRPEDRYTAQDNIDLQTTILSRFDLIFIVKDIRMYEQDKIIASHIIKVHSSASATRGENRTPVSKEENWLKSIVELNATPVYRKLLQDYCKIIMCKSDRSHLATEENVQEAIRLFTVSTMDAAKSGINQQINLSPEMARDIQQAENQIKRRIGIGNHISERRLIDDLGRMGMNESIVRRALLIMHQRDEVEYKRERRVVFRKA